MNWKMIEGYRWPYRINEDAVVQRQRMDGSWKTLKPFLAGGKKRGSGRMAVRMCVNPHQNTSRYLVDLMADAFMQGRIPGMIITHRNGMKTDCAACNLVYSTQREVGKRFGSNGRHSVEKVSPSGEVVALYRSVTEAAKKNYICRNAIIHRCQGRSRRPYALDGFTYRYEK